MNEEKGEISEGEKWLLFLAMFFFSDGNGSWRPSRTLDGRPRQLPLLIPLSMSFYAPPNQQRTLRACMVCSIVQLHNVRDAPLLPFLALPFAY